MKGRKIQGPVDNTKRTVRLAIKLAKSQPLERFQTFYLTDDDLEFKIDLIRENGGDARVVT
jgi:hypothetical protein